MASASPPKSCPHIFDLFTQAERSLDRSQGGLGIGLALVQRLVEMHGGTVTASSTLGKGSEFVVRLPVVPPPSSHASSTASGAAQRIGRSLRVLVVDDNVDTVTTLAMLVQESGHEFGRLSTARRSGNSPRLPTRRGAAGHRLAGTQWF